MEERAFTVRKPGMPQVTRGEAQEGKFHRHQDLRAESTARTPLNSHQQLILLETYTNLLFVSFSLQDCAACKYNCHSKPRRYHGPSGNKNRTGNISNAHLILTLR